MSTFKSAVTSVKRDALTANGAVTHSSSGSSLLDFFFLAGASRNTDVTNAFAVAYAEDKTLALRVALWMRDARGGAGERESFRRVLRHLQQIGEYRSITALIPFIPIVGRWDDLLTIPTQEVQAFIHEALNDGNGLCAKWMPRQAPDWLRGDYTPRQWRKLVVNLSHTVEQLMCAKQWDAIKFEHVPSIASARYQNAFARNCPHYEDYKKKLSEGKTTVHASAIFPHDILKAYQTGDKVVAQAQWDQQPNYLNADLPILPVVDVSGSMGTPVSGGSTAMDIALALGIYCADKLSGPFKDLVATFSATSKLYHIPGNLSAKVSKLMGMDWGMNTNLQAAFANILKVGLNNKVSDKDMPKIILILSDMEFDACARETNYSGIKQQYKDAGYTFPNVVFWNLNGRTNNVPVRMHKTGAALISGFSPAILPAVLGGEMTPMAVMNRAIMSDRYNIHIGV